MKPSALVSPATARRLALLSTTALVVLGLATAAVAQVPGIPKTPTGPFVQQNPITGEFMAPAGATIDWEITIFAPPGQEFAGSIIDEPQNIECNEGEINEWNQPGRAMETAPQSALILEDVDLDGDCDEAIINPPPGLTITCDPVRQRVEIRNISIPSNTAQTFTIRTLLDEATTSGQMVCNWAHLLDPTDMYRRSTAPPGEGTPGCSCVITTAPTAFDFEAEKTVALDNPPPLIPNDPSSTVVYTITARNTGGEDIAGMTLVDDLSMAPNNGLEWVEVVDCPAPLTCDITSPTMLSVSGYDLPGGMDPPAEQTIQVRAAVTCGAATDDDTGEICNQGQFTFMTGQFPTDDPSAPGLEDPTCTPVVFSNLTTSMKEQNGFDDSNGNTQLDPGERVHFLVTAQNAGRLTARDVIVTDDLGAPGCFDVASIEAPEATDITAGVVTWEIGDLAPGGLPAELAVSAIITDASCCNQAFLQSAERVECGLEPIPTDNPGTAMTAGDPTCAFTGPQPIIEAQKTAALENDADGNMEINIGDTVRWTVVIENTGSGPATAGSFTDVLSFCQTQFNGMPTVTTSAADGDWGDNNSTAWAPLPGPNGTVQIDRLGGDDGVQPGEIITIEFVALTQGTVEGCCNQGMVDFAEAAEPVLTDDPASTGRVGDETCLTPPTPDPAGELEKTLRLVDGNNDGFFCVGETVEYTLVMRSIGNADLTNIVIDDPSSACMQFDVGTVTIDPPALGMDTSTGNDVQVMIPTLAPAEEVTITFSGEALAEGQCCNQASWTSAEVPGPGLSDRDTSDLAPEQPTCHDVSCPPVPDVQLVLDKTVSPTGSCLDPGTVLTYTLTVRNTGADPVATFTIVDLVPTELLNVTPDAGDPRISIDPGTGEIRVDDGGALASGETTTFTYTAEVPCTEAGVATNTATLSYDDGTGTILTAPPAETTVDWGVPDLSGPTSTGAATGKSMTWADTTANGFVDVGEVITYTITVCNAQAATCDALGVVVTDTLDPRFDAGSFSDPDDGGAIAGSTVTWNLGDIAPDTCVTVDFDIEVVPTTDVPASIPNSFTADPTGNDISACAGTLPPLAQTMDASTDVPWGEQVVAGQVDLLRNAELTSRESALGSLAGTVFENETPNAGTCGETSLNIPPDVVQTGVGATIDAGLTVGGDAAFVGEDSPGVLIFYEASELCVPAEGGSADNLLCVRKSGDDIIVATSPDPATCP